MKKGFYMGQPLITKDTEEKATFIHDDGDTDFSCHVIKNNSLFSHDYYEAEHLEPATEFKFSEIIAGLEQGYFEVGMEFTMLGSAKTIEVKQWADGLYLARFSQPLLLDSKEINSTWRLLPFAKMVTPSLRKEMTLEEIEAELGHKIKLK